MEAIRKMEPAWKKIAQSKFGLGSYTDANGMEKHSWAEISAQYLQRLYRTYITLLFAHQDRVSVYRHEVQRRGSCQAGAEMGGTGASWRLFVDEMGGK